MEAYVEFDEDPHSPHRLHEPMSPEPRSPMTATMSPGIETDSVQNAANNRKKLS